MALFSIKKQNPQTTTIVASRKLQNKMMTPASHSGSVSLYSLGQLKSANRKGLVVHKYRPEKSGKFSLVLGRKPRFIREVTHEISFNKILYRELCAQFLENYNLEYASALMADFVNNGGRWRCQLMRQDFDRCIKLHRSKLYKDLELLNVAQYKFINYRYCKYLGKNRYVTRDITKLFSKIASVYHRRQLISVNKLRISDMTHSQRQKLNCNYNKFVYLTNRVSGLDDGTGCHEKITRTTEESFDDSEIPTRAVYNRTTRPLEDDELWYEPQVRIEIPDERRAPRNPGLLERLRQILRNFRLSRMTCCARYSILERARSWLDAYLRAARGVDTLRGISTPTRVDEIELDTYQRIIGPFDGQMESAANGQDPIITEKEGNVITTTHTEDVQTEAVTFPPDMWEKMCGGRPYTFPDLLEREINIMTFDWKTTDSNGSFIMDSTMPKSLLYDKDGNLTDRINEPNFRMFKQFAYFTGDMVFKLVCNCSPFLIGQLQMSAYYAAAQDAHYKDRLNIAVASQAPHVVLDAAASNDAILRVPFRYYKPLVGTTKIGDDDTFLNICNLRIAVLSQLRDVDQSTQTASLALSMWFENAKFYQMRPVSLAEGQMLPALGMMAAERALTQIFPDPNRDNPTSFQPPRTIVPFSAHSWSAGDGVEEPTNPLRVRLQGQTPHPPGSLPREPELDLSYIKSIRGLSRRLIWKESDTSGTLIFKIPFTPCVSVKTHMSAKVTNGAQERICYAVPPVGVISELFAYWRGSMEYLLWFVASRFHTGRLMMGYVPRYYGANMTIANLRQCDHVIIDLHGSDGSMRNQFVYTQSYTAERVWWPRRRTTDSVFEDYSPGTIYCVVLDKLTSGGKASKEIEILLYLSGGKDLEFHVPTLPTLALSFNTDTVVLNDTVTYTDTYGPPADIIYVSDYSGYWDGYCIFRYGTLPGKVTPFVCPKDYINKVYVIGSNHFNKIQMPCKDTAGNWRYANYAVFLPPGTIYSGGTDIYGIPFFDSSQAIKFSQTLKYDMTTKKYSCDMSKATKKEFDAAGEHYKSEKRVYWLIDAITAQNDDQRRDNPPVQLKVQPSPMTTDFGLLTFGEKISSFHQLLRRYQPYCTVYKINDNNFNPANTDFVIPILPQGLDLDVGTSASPITYNNIVRDGPIPLILSGYRFYRGGLRLRLIAASQMTTTFWVQHRPDYIPNSFKSEVIVDIKPQKQSTKHLFNPNYSFMVQSTNINNVIEFSVPFYQPGKLGLLQRPNTNLSQDGSHYCLGSVAVGSQIEKPKPNTQEKKSSISLTGFYSVDDDFSPSVFQGFPLMFPTDQYLAAGNPLDDFQFPIHVDGQMFKGMFNSVKQKLAKEAVGSITEEIQSSIEEVVTSPEGQQINDFWSKFKSFIPEAFRQSVWAIISQVGHCLINFDYKTIAWSIASILVTLGIITHEVLLSFEHLISQFLQLLGAFTTRKACERVNPDTTVGQGLHFLRWSQNTAHHANKVINNSKTALIAGQDMGTLHNARFNQQIHSKTERIEHSRQAPTQPQLGDASELVNSFTHIAQDPFQPLNPDQHSRIKRFTNWWRPSTSCDIDESGNFVVDGQAPYAQDPEEQVKVSILSSMVSMIVSAANVTCNGIPKSIPDFFASVAREAGNYTRNANGLFVFFRNNLLMFKRMYRWVMSWCFPEYRFFLEVHSDTRLEQMIRSCQQFLDPRNSDKIRVDHGTQVRLFELAQVIEVLKARACADETALKMQHTFRYFDRIVSLRDKLVEEMKCPSVRYEPMVICFVGQSSVGKSFIASQTSIKLLKEGIKLKYAGFPVYIRTPGIPFWNGLKDQPICVIDDFLAVMTPGILESQLSDLFSLKTSAVFNPPMAELAEKNLRYNPLLVAMCMNNPYPEIKEAGCPTAWRRRRDVMVHTWVHPCADCEKTIPDDYQYNTSNKTYCKYSHHPKEAQKDFSYLRFRYYKDPGEPDATGPYNNFTGKVLTYNEFFETLKAKHLEYHARESENVCQRYRDQTALMPPPEEIDLGTFDYTTVLEAYEDGVFDQLDQESREQLQYASSSLIQRMGMAYDRYLRKVTRPVGPFDYRKTDHSAIIGDQIINNIVQNALTEETPLKMQRTFIQDITAYKEALVPGQMLASTSKLSVIKEVDGDDNDEVEETTEENVEVQIVKELKAIDEPEVIKDVDGPKLYSQLVAEYSEKYRVPQQMFQFRNLRNKEPIVVICKCCLFIEKERADSFDRDFATGVPYIRLAGFKYNYDKICDAKGVNCIFKNEEDNDLARHVWKATYENYFKDIATGAYSSLMRERSERYQDVKCVELSGMMAEVKEYRRLSVLTEWFKNSWFGKNAWRILKVLGIAAGVIGTIVAFMSFGKIGSKKEVEGEMVASGTTLTKGVKSIASPGIRRIVDGSIDCAEQQMRDLKRRIIRNTCHLICYYRKRDSEEDFKSERMRLLGLCGNYALSLGHYHSAIEDIRADPENEVLFEIQLHGSRIPIVWADVHVSRIEESEATIIRFDRSTMPQFKNLVGQIAPNSFSTNMPPDAMILDVEFGSDCTEISMVSVRLRREINQTLAIRAPRGPNTFTTKYYSYDWPGLGRCMSVIVANFNTPTPILGVHVAGNVGVGGFAELLTQETFLELSNKVREAPYIPEDFIPAKTVRQWEEARPKLRLVGDMLALGQVLEPARVASSSRLVNTLCAGKITDIKYEKPVLTRGDPRIRESPFSPLLEGCKNHADPPMNFPRSVLDAAADDFENVILSVVKPQRIEVGKLTVEQSICGLLDNPLYGKLAFDTSEGYPWNQCRPAGVTDKSWLFDLQECPGGYQLKTMLPELKTCLEEREKSRLKGEIQFIVFADTLKDAKLPREKVLIPGKTRIFSMSPIDFTIQIRQMFMDFAVAYQASRFESETAIGIDVNSLEWNQLAKYLLENSPNFVCGDYSKFGDKLMSNCVLEVFKIISNWYIRNGDTDPGHIKIRQCMAYETAHAVHLMHDFLYQTYCGMPSGNALTAVINSMVNSLYIRCLWYLITRSEAPSLFGFDKFHENVRLVTYGDDLIMTVKDSALEYFNGQTIAKVLGYFNIKYTDAAKTGVLTKSFPIDAKETTFLKQNFVFNNARQIWCAQHDLDSALEICNWTWSTCRDIESASIASSTQMMESLHGHGKEIYDQYRTKVMQFWQNRGVRVIVPTFEEVDIRRYGI